MLRVKQILVSAIVLSASVLNLSACGQTGDLYLPTKTGPSKASASDPPPNTPLRTESTP